MLFIIKGLFMIIQISIIYVIARNETNYSLPKVCSTVTYFKYLSIGHFSSRTHFSKSKSRNDDEVQTFCR